MNNYEKLKEVLEIIKEENDKNIHLLVVGVKELEETDDFIFTFKGNEFDFYALIVYLVDNFSEISGHSKTYLLHNMFNALINM